MAWATLPYKGVETLLFVLEIALMNFNLDCLPVCLLRGAGWEGKGEGEISAVNFHLLAGIANTREKASRCTAKTGPQQGYV